MGLLGKAPEAVRGSVLGILRAAALLLTSLSFPLLGLIFEHFSTGAGAAPCIFRSAAACAATSADAH